MRSDIQNTKKNVSHDSLVRYQFHPLFLGFFLGLFQLFSVVSFIISTLVVVTLPPFPLQKMILGSTPQTDSSLS